MRSKRVYVTYDPTANAGYVYLQRASARKPGSSMRSVRVSQDVIIDFDSQDRVVGIEFLNAQKHLPKSWWRDSDDRKR